MASVEEQRVIESILARLDTIEIKLGLQKAPPTAEEIAAAEAAAKDAQDKADFERLTAKFGASGARK